jgi:hypothetical protein
MFLHLADQPLNGLSAPDLQATPQRTQMTAAVKSWITRLEFGKKFYSGLIRMLFQPFKHFRPVSCAALRTRAMSAGLVTEATVFGPRDHDAPSTRILTPLFHAFCEAIYVLRMKASWELNAELIEQLCSSDIRKSFEAAAQ